MDSRIQCLRWNSDLLGDRRRGVFQERAGREEEGEKGGEERSRGQENHGLGAGSQESSLHM